MLVRDGGLRSGAKVHLAEQTVEGRAKATWQWGVFGHSHGAHTALEQEDAYPLGRVAVCANVYEPATDFPGLAGSDPLLLVWSDGDGCNADLADPDLRNGIKSFSNWPTIPQGAPSLPAALAVCSTVAWP